MPKFSNDYQPSDGKRKEGRGKRKVMTEALMIALNREDPGEDGRPTKRAMIIAEKLAVLAVSGDLTAIRECFDRSDGKPQQENLNTNTPGLPPELEGMTSDDLRRFIAILESVGSAGTPDNSQGAASGDGGDGRDGSQPEQTGKLPTLQ